MSFSLSAWRITKAERDRCRLGPITSAAFRPSATTTDRNSYQASYRQDLAD
jgi:hypothetical protein